MLTDLFKAVGSQMGLTLFPREQLIVSGHISECQTERMCSTGVLWEEARDAAKTSYNAQIRPPQQRINWSIMSVV